MTARSFVYGGQHYDVSGEGYRVQGKITLSTGRVGDVDLEPLLVPMVACNDSRFDDGKAIGDPMEAALLVLAAKGGVRQGAVESALPRVAELPFDSAHKFMATFHRDGALIRVFVKGAPDVLLARCTHCNVGGVEAAFGASEVAQVEADYRDLAGHGLRGLLIASRTLPVEAFDAGGDLSACIAELHFVGLVGLMDPPRPEAMQAIAECRAAGIVVKMITGDHQATASAIAAELGLHGRAVSGADIDRMDAAQLPHGVADTGMNAAIRHDFDIPVGQ